MRRRGRPGRRAGAAGIVRRNRPAAAALAAALATLALCGCENLFARGSIGSGGGLGDTEVGITF
ncbi:MAG: hypothetical protein R3F55_09950 [Alphaproteobacteria bacterium]